MNITTVEAPATPEDEERYRALYPDPMDDLHGVDYGWYYEDDSEPDYEAMMEDRWDEEAALEAAERRYERGIYGD